MKVHARKWIEYITTALMLATVLLLVGCAGTMARIQDGFQAQRAYDAGLSRYQAKDYAGAITHLEKAVTLDPNYDDAKAQLAWSYYHTGQYLLATRHFRQALVRQPQWPGLYDGLGWSRYRQGRYNLALDAFQHAVALDPSYRDAGVGLAYSLFALERYREALPHLERLTREGEANGLRSASSDLDQVRSRYAWTLFYVGDYPKARDQFAKAVAARPDWAGLHNGFGWTLLRMGDPQKAGEQFEEALKLEPELADAKEGLTQVEAQVKM
ncbi:MAG TPA: tetratricopeptide repeat protein [Candidatus Methylomirabilis sp.]|nr:tetratricopeptide repeat protein [Candidatus Methylomirabilis sp.]